MNEFFSHPFRGFTERRQEQPVPGSDLSASEAIASEPPLAPSTPPVFEEEPEEQIFQRANSLSVDSRGDDLLELGEELNLYAFEVVRREYFAHLHEPSITFNNWKFSVNTACLTRFPDANYSEVLVNRKTKQLALRPCVNKERDSFPWSSVNSKGKRLPRQITSKLFSAMVFEMMGWSHENRYKILGRVIHTNGEYMILFDLNSREAYPRISKDGEKPRTSRKPVLPEDWQGQFGLPYYEHKKYLQISVIDGYAVFSLADKPASDGDTAEKENELEQNQTPRQGGGY